jgi:hypothetical protein
MTLPCSLPGCRVTEVVHAAPNTLLITAHGRGECVRCPNCRTGSTTVHSRYRRHAADLPASGRAVRLRLVIRRFYCRPPDCPRRTFAERLPGLLDRGAQRTRRLVEAQARIGIALGGVPGAKLASQLAMPLSADTLLRGVRAQPLPPPPEPPRTVGVDDWALRKGRTYGSVLVDLDRRRVLDLLPDRSAPTFANWLERHPHVATIARDRSTEYARGAALGAPDAVQVADRWHLLFNTRQMVERWLVRAYPRLRRLPPPVSAPPAASFRRGRAYPRARSEALARAQARGRWEALYDEVRRRHAGGQPLRSIHRETGLARATVRKYALSDSFPRHGLRGPTPSILDPFLPHLQARWDEGCENAMALWREVVALGFPGTPKQVRRWLSERRRQPAKTTDASSPPSSAHQARSGRASCVALAQAALVASAARARGPQCERDRGGRRLGTGRRRRNRGGAGAPLLRDCPPCRPPRRRAERVGRRRLRRLARRGTDLRQPRRREFRCQP